MIALDLCYLEQARYDEFKAAIVEATGMEWYRACNHPIQYGCLYLFYHRSAQKYLLFYFREMRCDLLELKDILYIGLPIGLQNAFCSLANVVFTTAVNGFGSDATTGVSIAGPIDSVIYNISYAPALAVSPYIAQNVVARNIPRVKKALLYAVGIIVTIGGVSGALASVFSKELLSIMSSSPSVIAFAMQKAVLLSATYFVCGIYEVMCGTMCGLGKPIIPTISTLLFMCLLRFVWVYAIFPLLPNLTFLYLVWPIG